MNKVILTVMSMALVLGSCGRNAPKEETQPESFAFEWNGYKRTDPASVEENVMELIGKRWMLITSGDSLSYNTMTASWGALGNIWSRPVALITVRNTRYTYEFLQRNSIFTLSFFPEEYRPALLLLGTKSGRDGDKVKESGLTPMSTPEGSMSFGEATMIMECRKLYEDRLDPKSILDDEIAMDYISHPGEYHQLYIGEILSVWVK